MSWFTRAPKVVFVLLEDDGSPPVGEVVTGVYSSRRRAENAADRASRRTVEAFEVDGKWVPCDDDWNDGDVE